MAKTKTPKKTEKKTDPRRDPTADTPRADVRAPDTAETEQIPAATTTDAAGTSSNDEPRGAQERVASAATPSVTERDAALFRKYADMFARIADGIESGNGDAARDTFRDFRRLVADSHRLVYVARRSMTREPTPPASPTNAPEPAPETGATAAAETPAEE